MAAILKATGLPIVDVAAVLPRPDFPRVVTDRRAATQLVFDHLLEREFRHFACYGDNRFWWSSRRQGYFKAQVRLSGKHCAVFNPQHRGDNTESE